MTTSASRLDRRIKFSGDSQANRTFVLSDSTVISIIENEDGLVSEGWTSVCDERGYCKKMLKERYNEIKSRRVQLLDPYSSKDTCKSWREKYAASDPITVETPEKEPKYKGANNIRCFTDAFIRGHKHNQYYQEVFDVYEILERNNFEETPELLMECAEKTAHSVDAVRRISKFIRKDRFKPIFVETFKRGPLDE